MSGGGGGNGNKIQTYEDFVSVHGILLAASGIPQSLYRLLFEKLSNESFDGGEFFQIEPVEEVEGRQRRLVFTSDFMHKESNIFLVDHAWTFRFSDAYKQVWMWNDNSIHFMFLLESRLTIYWFIILFFFSI